MHPNPKVRILVEKISETVNHTITKNPCNVREITETYCCLLSQIGKMVCDVVATLDVLNKEEQTMISIVNQYIRPVFDTKRQILLSQLPAVRDANTKQQILEQIKQMLHKKTMTLDDGLLIAGELVSTVTYLKSSTVESQSQIQELEIDTLNHIKGKLTLALDAIQAEQGFVTKQ